MELSEQEVKNIWNNAIDSFRERLRDIETKDDPTTIYDLIQKELWKT